MGKHIYIHIPFCHRKCPYCSFYSVKPDDENVFIMYKNAIIREIELFGNVEGYSEDNGDDTIYFGGGTPTIMPEKYLSEILNRISEVFKIDISNCSTEITIEANPFTVDKDKLFYLRECGFNRISIGVQSLHNDILNTLGRIHNSEQAITAVTDAIETGFTNVSADLIIGVPGQTYEDVIEDTEKLVKLGVKHISTYSLSIEVGTPFEKQYKFLDDYVNPDTERKMYHGLRSLLRDNGFIDYEISNSALPGYESRHNNCYWNASEYYAFGAGAHGYINSTRFSHENDVKRYIDLLSQSVINVNEVAIEEEKLTEFDKMKEYMLLSFRTQKGVDLNYFKLRFGGNAQVLFKNEIDKLVTNGLIRRCGDNFVTTQKGLDFANLIFEEFV